MSVESDIREGFRQRLATIGGLNATAEQPNTIIPPSAWPVPSRQAARLTFSGTDKVETYDIYLVVAPTDFVSAQKSLAAWVSPHGSGSVEGALYADPTLSGSVLGIMNVTLAHYGNFPTTSALAAFIGAVWAVDVLVA